MLAHVLQERELVISDVIAGAASGTRRLFLGERATDRLRLAVGVVHGEGGEEAVANEARALAVLDERLPHELHSSVPHVHEWVLGPGGRHALLVSAVAGLESGATPTPTPNPRGSFDAMVAWLVQLWAATTGDRIHVELGRGAVDLVLSRHRGAASIRPSIDILLRARERLALVEVVGVMAHGCLCARHVFHDASQIGVDDWGLARSNADPLGDLGRYAVDISGDRFPEVVKGRTRFAAAVRDALCHGMEAVATPPRLWRDVLLLAQLEVALTELKQGDTTRLALLQQSVQALPKRT